MSKDYKNHDQMFRKLLANWPKPGAILESLHGEPAEVMVRGAEDNRTLFTTAVIDDECTGWYLRYEPRGVMVMIDLRDHERLLRRAAELGPNVTVDRLRVLRKSARGTALICKLLEKN